MKEEGRETISALWEKIRISSTLIATVIIPFIIVIVSNNYTAAIKENEIGVRYVEIAISILKAPPNTSTVNLRKWAVQVVNHYSQVPLSQNALTELREEDLSNLLKALHDQAMTPIRKLR